MRAAHDDAFEFPYIALDHPAIQYAAPATHNVISRLQEKIGKGQVKLDYDARYGYLPSLLKNLDIPRDSQMLVFSRTSFQGPKISPQHPRAIYFSDQAAVGFVPQGDVMELAAVDSEKGVVFYTLDLDKAPKPEFVRPKMECIQCHVYPGTLNLPGLTVTSVIPTPDGTPRFPASAITVDSRTAFESRWGGWYVTGTSGTLQHRGNAVAPFADRPSVLDYRGNQNLTSLKGRVDTSAYLEPSSDIIALMTIEHQTRATDLLVRLAWETRIAAKEGKLDDFRNGRLNLLADQVVRYLLFADEAKLYEPVTGVSTFVKTFPERGPRDPHGRSLRDFDLQTRLFRYPLSFMIYSPVFDALPDLAKERVYQGLFSALTKENGGFANLSATDRRAIYEIVRDTRTGLPDYWK